MRFGFPGGGGGGGTPGITRVADAAARLLITPATDGFTVLQLDTDEIYDWNLPTGTWRRLAGPQLAFTYTDSNSIDFTYDPLAQDLVAELKVSGSGPLAGGYNVQFQVLLDGLFAEIPFADAGNDGILTSGDWVLFDQARQDINAHLDGAPGKHAATEITFTPTGLISSTTVQTAIAELQTEVYAAINALDLSTDARLDALELIDHVAVTVLPFSGVANSAGLSLNVQQLTLHAATGTTPGGVSTTTQSFGGDKTFLSNIIGEVDIRMADRSAPAPAYVFLNDPSTGFYRLTTGTVGLSTNGTGRYRFSPTGMNVGTDSALNDSEALAVNLPGSIKLGSATQTQVAAWTTTQPGAMVYNSTELQANVFVNSGWQHMGGKLRLVASDPLLLSPAGSFNGNPFFRCMRRVAGNAAPVTATVSRTGCVDGMELYIVGTSDTNTVTLEPDSNLAINGTITLGNGDTLQLVFDGAANIWREFGRSD